MKAEQKASSPIGMPRITKLGQLDPSIAGGNELETTVDEDLTLMDETKEKDLDLE